MSYRFAAITALTLILIKTIQGERALEKAPLHIMKSQNTSKGLWKTAFIYICEHLSWNTKHGGFPEAGSRYISKLQVLHTGVINIWGNSSQDLSATKVAVHLAPTVQGSWGWHNYHSKHFNIKNYCIGELFFEKSHVNSFRKSFHFSHNDKFSNDFVTDVHYYCQGNKNSLFILNDFFYK